MSSSKPGRDDLEFRKLYHSALMDEFKSIRSEIVAMLVEGKKTLAMVTASIPLSAFLAIQDSSGEFKVAPELLCVATLIYLTLAAYMLRNMWTTRAYGRYLVSLGDRLDWNLLSLTINDPKPSFPVLQWEVKGPKLIQLPREIWLINLAPLAIPLIPACFLMGVSYQQLADGNEHWLALALWVLDYFGLFYIIRSGLFIFTSLTPKGVNPQGGI